MAPSGPHHVDHGQVLLAPLLLLGQLRDRPDAVDPQVLDTKKVPQTSSESSKMNKKDDLGLKRHGNSCIDGISERFRSGKEQLVATAARLLRLAMAKHEKRGTRSTRNPLFLWISWAFSPKSQVSYTRAPLQLARSPKTLKGKSVGALGWASN